MPFLIAGTTTLLLLLVILVVQRLVRAVALTRRSSLVARYRPRIDAALHADSPAALEALARMPIRHRRLAGDLVLATLRVIRGGTTARAAAIAERLGLTATWRLDLNSRRWWHRADAAVALGLLHDRPSVPALIELLNDDHAQVRAAVVDALGQIGDATAVPALLEYLDDPKRLERTRVVEALRALGASATTALVEFGETHEHERGPVASILGFVGGASAAAPLLSWSGSDNAATRAEVWRALGAIGLDDRAFYHALKGLGDEDPAVRAAVALALARSGRVDATPHLARHLDDDWAVAAQSARALLTLGADGHAALSARVAHGPGLGHDLARQVLWEGGHR